MAAKPTTSQGKSGSGLKVITPTAIAAYAHVWRPTVGLNEDKGPQYSVVLIFPKGTNLDPLKAAAKKAADKKWGAKKPGGLKNPFRDGNRDKPDKPEFKGCTFITVRTVDKPGIVDANNEAITDEMDFYSGCKCRASIVASAFDMKGSRGVTFYLQNLQKVGDGTRLSGRSKAEDDFEAIDEEGYDGDADDEDDPFG